MGGNGPPLTWAREAAVDELDRIVRRFPFEDFDRDVRPRLARLALEQRATVEEGLISVLGLVEEADTRRVSERLLDLLGFVGALPDQARRA
jgi:hypothetical protein